MDLKPSDKRPRIDGGNHEGEIKVNVSESEEKVNKPREIESEIELQEGFEEMGVEEIIEEGLSDKEVIKILQLKFKKTEEMRRLEIEEKNKKLQENDREMQENNKKLQEIDREMQEKDRELELERIKSTEKDERNYKKDIELQEKDRELYAKSVQRLFKEGLKGFKIIRNIGTMSSYTSSHNAANIVSNGRFGLIENLEHFLHRITNNTSVVLAAMQDRNEYYYSNEQGLAILVNHVLCDVIRMCNLSDRLMIVAEKTIMQSAKKSYRPDAIVIEIGGKPVTVAEYKTPYSQQQKQSAGSTDPTVFQSKLNNASVLGQMFDYLTMFRTFFGRVEMYGILTDFEGFRICWLPDIDAAAARTTWIPDDSAVDLIHFATTRELCCTGVYHKDDPMLIKALMSAMLKSYHGRIVPVSLLSHTRLYLVSSQDSWGWVTLPKGFDIRLPLVCGVPDSYEALYIVRHVSSKSGTGADGRVVFALSTTQHMLTVMKMFHSISSDASSMTASEKADLECFMWTHVWKVRTIRCVVAGWETLIMPPVFTADIDGKLSITTRDWVTCDWETDIDVNALARIESQAKACFEAKAWTLDMVQQAAVDAMMQAGYRHGDLKNEHVGLLPITNEEGEIVELRPVLIDLSRVVKIADD